MALRISIGTGLGALALGAILALAGCELSTSDEEAVVTSRITGSVGDGPVVDARLRVFSNSGDFLTETRSTSSADYEITVSTQRSAYPLLILADEGTDLVTNAPPDFSMRSVIMDPGDQEIANLNPYSTLIVRAAEKSGSLNERTIAEVTQAVVRRYGFGLDPDLVPDPISTPMDESNVHVIVKASETLGEMIRRTRDVLITAGTWVDGDAVVEALAADLVDGWVDGRGAAGHDPRIAAIANVASAAVLLEAMANRLHVYGIDATEAMDQAIRFVRPGSTVTTRDVAIPANALTQAARALEAATLVSDDSRIAQVLEALQDLSPGRTELDSLPSGIERALNDAILASAYISDPDQLDAINHIASNGGEPDTGTVRVSWTAPTEREGGHALDDLAGHRVYYGRDANALTQVSDVRDPRQTHQLIENLEAGTWYFAVTAYDSMGLESDKSEIGNHTIH